VMLQQTRVETVRPRYAEFLARFPTVDALASAPIDDVLALWSGLGYYSRARNLHSAANQIIDAGEFPSDVKGLLALKGVGTYIAGAVGSIALGLPVPAVDGNLERVLARLHCSVGGRPEMTRVAEALLLGCPERAGDINQALMDLGSTVCTPKSPRCADCPLSAICRGFQTESQTRWPEKKARRKAPLRAAVAGVLQDDQGRLLVARRPPTGLFGGLFELPGVLLAATARSKPGPTVLASAWLDRMGVEVDVGASLGSVSHTLTHMRLTLHIFAVSNPALTSGQDLEPRDFYDQLVWATPEALDEMGISTLTRKALATVASAGQQDLFRRRAPR
jgi:A/G-specific adenine glycosylase